MPAQPSHDIHGGEAGISLRGLGVETVVIQVVTEEGFEVEHGRFGPDRGVVNRRWFSRP